MISAYEAICLLLTSSTFGLPHTSLTTISSRYNWKINTPAWMISGVSETLGASTSLGQGERVVCVSLIKRSSFNPFKLGQSIEESTLSCYEVMGNRMTVMEESQTERHVLREVHFSSTKIHDRQVSMENKMDTIFMSSFYGGRDRGSSKPPSLALYASSNSSVRLMF